MFVSDSGLDLSIALGSWPGIASTLPETMALFGGTYELWFWGTLQVGWGGLESRNTAILLFHVLGRLVGLYPSAGHLSSTTVILNVFGSFVGCAWQCCGSFRDLFCQALCSLLCIQTKLKHCFCLLRAFWGLGWESPPGRKVCIKVKLLVVVWRDALVRGKAWPFPEPWPCHVLSFTSLVLAPAVGLYLRSFDYLCSGFPPAPRTPVLLGTDVLPAPRRRVRQEAAHPTPLQAGLLDWR